MNWDTIFRAGTWTSSSGKTKNWTAQDLDRLYEANKGETPPIVMLHPKDQDKAMNFGKIAVLRRTGEKLQAQYADVPEILKLAVKEGLKLAKSISVDPVTMKIRHIGLLGAGQEPAVDGLGAANFSAETGGEALLTYMYDPTTTNKEGQMDPKDQKIKELEGKIKTLEADTESKKLQEDLNHAQDALKKEKDAHQETKDEFSRYKSDQADKALEARVDALADTLRIKPEEKAKTLAYAKAMDADGETMEFSKADGTREKVSPRENYLRDLEARQPDPDGILDEFATPDKASAGKKEDAVPEDINDYA